MATVTFNDLVCNKSLSSVQLYFSVLPNPVMGSTNMTAGVPVGIGASRHFSPSGTVTLFVGTVPLQQTIPATPGSRTLRFPFSGATFTLNCYIS